MRENYIDWDSYFMGIALLSSMRSKDPNTQVGACIVNEDKRIVGVGYNGLPKGCEDTDFPWEREGEFLDTKYPYVCHAELNAILNSIKSLKDCIIYVALFPCHECTKAIIQSGIIYYILFLFALIIDFICIYKSSPFKIWKIVLILLYLCITYYLIMIIFLLIGEVSL